MMYPDISKSWVSRRTEAGVPISRMFHEQNCPTWSSRFLNKTAKIHQLSCWSQYSFPGIVGHHSNLEKRSFLSVNHPETDHPACEFFRIQRRPVAKCPLVINNKAIEWRTSQCIPYLSKNAVQHVQGFSLLHHGWPNSAIWLSHLKMVSYTFPLWSKSIFCASTIILIYVSMISF